MTRVEERERHARLQQEAVARLGEDMAWNARRQADYQLAMSLSIGRNTDRFVQLVQSWAPSLVAADELLSAHAGLRAVT